MTLTKGATTFAQLFGIDQDRAIEIRLVAIACHVIVNWKEFPGQVLDAYGYLDNYFTDLTEKQIAFLEFADLTGKLSARGMFGTDADRDFRGTTVRLTKAGIVLGSFDAVPAIIAEMNTWKDDEREEYAAEDDIFGEAVVVEEESKVKLIELGSEEPTDKAVGLQNTTQVD